MYIAQHQFVRIWA